MRTNTLGIAAFATSIGVSQADLVSKFENYLDQMPLMWEKPKKNENREKCQLNISKVSSKSSLSLFCQGALSGPKSSYLTDRVSAASQPFKLTL